MEKIQVLIISAHPEPNYPNFFDTIVDGCTLRTKLSGTYGYAGDDIYVDIIPYTMSVRGKKAHLVIVEDSIFNYEMWINIANVTNCQYKGTPFHGAIIPMNFSDATKVKQMIDTYATAIREAKYE